MAMIAPPTANQWAEAKRLNDAAMNAWALHNNPGLASQTAAGVPVAGTAPTATGTPAVTSGNNITSIEQLAQQINAINQKAQQAANAGRIPNATGLEAQSSANIANYLAGKVPIDVINQIGQQAAQRGVATGSPLGANTNAAYLRALGLTSLDLMNQGQNQLTSALARNPAAPLYNAGELVITPTQQAQLDLQLKQLAQQQQQFEKNLELERQRLATTQANLALNHFGTGGINYQGPSTSWWQPATNWSDVVSGQPDTTKASRDAAYNDWWNPIVATGPAPSSTSLPTGGSSSSTQGPWSSYFNRNLTFQDALDLSNSPIMKAWDQKNNEADFYDWALAGL